MSKNMKVNIIHTIMWTLVAIGLIIIFSLPNTIANWGDNRTKTILLAVLFLLGFGVDFVLRMIERSRQGEYKKDERDSKVKYDAVVKSFVVLILYIYILSIVLYSKYENAGAMPVGWVWFIAYSVVTAANLFVGIFTIIGYKKQGM